MFPADVFGSWNRGKQEAACGIRVGNYKAPGRLHASPHPPEERSETHAISRHFTSTGGMIPEVTKPAEKTLKAKGMSNRENDKKETKQIREEVMGDGGDWRRAFLVFVRSLTFRHRASSI